MEEARYSCTQGLIGRRNALGGVNPRRLPGGGCLELGLKDFDQTRMKGKHRKSERLGHTQIGFK